METTGLPASLELGAGHRATFLFNAGASMPYGLLEQHRTAEGVDCQMVVPWVDRVSAIRGDHAVWTLESLRPLSLAEPMRCSRCGTAGQIRAGNWLREAP